MPAIGLLLLSHTRTATLGLVAGARRSPLLSLVLTTRAGPPGVHRAAVVGGLSSPCVLARPCRRGSAAGRTTRTCPSLTGRAKVWDALLAAPRTISEQLFGVGLTNKSFDGLPIDSSWLAVYHEQGYVGHRARRRRSC